MTPPIPLAPPLPPAQTHLARAPAYEIAPAFTPADPRSKLLITKSLARDIHIAITQRDWDSPWQQVDIPRRLATTLAP